MKVEDVADPVGHDGSAGAAGDIPMQIIGIARHHGLVVDGEVGDKDAHGGPGHAFHRDTSTLEALVDNLKEFALLRIHVRSLKVVNAEEAIIKRPDVLVDEVATWDIGCAAAVPAIGVVEAVNVVSFGWYGALGRLLVDDEVPEVRGGANISRKTTCHSHDNRWIVLEVYRQKLVDRNASIISIFGLGQIYE